MYLNDILSFFKATPKVLVASLSLVASLLPVVRPGARSSFLLLGALLCLFKQLSRFV